jgi:hypothetical protein
MPNSDPAYRMRRYAIALLAFLLPIALVWVGLEWWAAKIPSSHSAKRENLQRISGDVDTLILGSSSAYWDISPQLLPGTAFNLANVAQSFYYDDRLLAAEMPKLPHLRRVILSVTYISLFFQLHGSDEDERQYYYYQEWNIPPPRLREDFDIRMLSRAALKTPITTLESFVTAVKQRAHGGTLAPAALDPAVDDRGWSPRDPGNPSELEPAVVEAKLKYHHGLMHISDAPANIEYLEHMIGLLNERHIELVLVTPPVWAAYSSRIAPHYWNRTQEIMTELARSPNVRYFSFLTAPQFQAADFMDTDHLNRNGAVRFTAMLNAAIGSGD